MSLKRLTFSLGAIVALGGILIPAATANASTAEPAGVWTGAQIEAGHNWVFNQWCSGGTESVSGNSLTLKGSSGGGCEDVIYQVPVTAGTFTANVTDDNSNTDGHPAYWLSGFTGISTSPQTNWTKDGEIDAAEDTENGHWSIFYHADGAANAYSVGNTGPDQGQNYVVKVVRTASQTYVYYNGVLEGQFAEQDNVNGKPSPLLIAFDTSGSNSLTIKQIYIKNG